MTTASSRVVDLSSVSAALDAKDAAAFDTALAPLGLALELDTLLAYVRRWEENLGSLSLAQQGDSFDSLREANKYTSRVAFGLVEVISVALREPAAFGFSQWVGRYSLLAVALEERLVVALQPCKQSQPFPKTGWKMGRWYTDPARNRPTVDAWANDPARAADSLTLARPAAPRQLEARGPALLRAVLERPDDDEPRLVYADWLTEQGDARGELIQVQCELAGMALSRERRRALRAREKQLLQGSRAALASLEALSESSSIERGLVSGVTLFAPKLVKHCAELRASHPIVHFEVVASKPEELVKLAALAPLMGVPKLTIQARRTPRIYQSRAHLALVATAKSPIWSRTRELGLEHVDDSDEEWGAFFSGLAAPELDTLVTRAAQFTPTALRALAASGSLPALRRVVLDYPAMGQSAEGAGEVAAALSALAARGVRGLGLHSWHMGDTALASCLRAFTDHGTLTDLSIVNCKFGPRTLEWLSGAKQLERLEMGNNGRWGLSLVELADCVRSLSKLREVVLHERDVAREAAAAMTDAWMALPSLERVRLRESPLTDEEVERLMRHTGYWE